MNMPKFDRQSRQLVTRARTLGTNGLYLEDNVLLRLCAVVAADLDKQDLMGELTTDLELMNGYYGIPLEWFDQSVPKKMQFVDTFLALKQNIEDFVTYFEKLCELHKRRLKFKLILEHQAFPQMEQIVPRCLLEFGLRPSETLASWLVWRKWLYDIDNRSAQETGYLFEPILAAAIGGVPYAATNSPVKRADNPQKGRQVDCIDGKLAYEFKMRVTIAASGQGRFREELDFARDCYGSGYVPILLVLDPTPSARLDELKAEYAKYNGSAYIGNDAWEHVEEKAGNVMGKFVEKYVKVPLREVDDTYKRLQPIRLENTETAIVVQIGDNVFSISRSGTKHDYEELDRTSIQDEQ